MFSNPLLKITTKKPIDKFIQTNNLDTYFIISDFTNIYDGLWFNNFHLFNSISIENNKNIESKTLTPFNLQISLTNKLLISLFLLKNNNGIIVELKNKNLIQKINKNYIINFNINEKIQILEKNIKNIILEYSKANKKIFCAIASVDYDFENIKQSKEGITFSLNTLNKLTTNPEFYIFYHTKYNDIKNILENNTNNISNLKTDHLSKSLLPLKYTNFHTDEKSINKALLWSILSSNNLVATKNKTYAILSGIPEDINFYTKNIFNSLAGTTLVSGLYEKARKILINISNSQCKNHTSKDYGKIPDFIDLTKNLTYVAIDSTPLFIRSIYEYFIYTSDYKLIILLWENIELAIEKVYLSKKDNNNFIKQSIDNNYNKIQEHQKSFYKLRKGICLETQALWYTALYCASFIAKKIAIYKNKKGKINNKTFKELINTSKKYKEESKKIKKAFIKNFIKNKAPYIFDNPSKNLNLYPLHAIFYSTLPGIPSLVDNNTVINYIKYLIHQLNLDELKENSKEYNNKIISLFFNKFINVLCKYGLYNFAYKQTEFIKDQILENNTLGTLSDNALIDQKNGMNVSESFSCSSLISEFARSFFQDYLGIKMFVPERKIYINTSIPAKLNNVNYKLRFGYKENLLCYIRLSKKSLNISYIEIKGLLLKKYILVYLKIHLGFEQKKDKFQYKQTIIKLKLNKSDDLIRISFDSIKPNLIKIKDITSLGSSIICGIKQKTEILDENLEN